MLNHRHATDQNRIDSIMITPINNKEKCIMGPVLDEIMSGKQSEMSATIRKARVLTLSERLEIVDLRVFDVLGGRRDGVEIGEHVVVLRAGLAVCDCTASSHEPRSHVLSVADRIDMTLERVPLARLALAGDLRRAIWAPVARRCDKHLRCYRVSNVEWGDLKRHGVRWSYVGRSRHSPPTKNLVRAVEALGIGGLDRDELRAEADEHEAARVRAQDRRRADVVAETRAPVRTTRMSDRVQILSRYDARIINAIKSIEDHVWTGDA
jgi:hypothetical protein